ncbi:25S rRNA (adenine645-N1)-methyltransferase [Coemansia sp. Benny D115]|nr:25S rRNA (adenine645-N1)-methyltransferase [Coemansia sp. Benny D115]
MAKSASKGTVAKAGGSAATAGEASGLHKVKKQGSSGHNKQRLTKVKALLASQRERAARQTENKTDTKDSRSGSGSGSAAKATTTAKKRIAEPGSHKSAAAVAKTGQQDKQKEKSGQGLSALQKKMQQKLKGARFRWINEALYTTTGDRAFEMVQGDPSIFEEYHQGFTAQVEKWPVNPVDVFIKQLKSRERLTVADMGCGEAKLAAAINTQHTVHSFDLVAYNELITPCNIANVPLGSATTDVVVFCLALMGTDFIKFIREANRILRRGGELKIAEVVSRIANVDAFVAELEAQGFKLKHKDMGNKMFIMLDFVKTSQSPAKLEQKEGLLKPCIYKRR